jgi:hypothetical protein
MEQFLQYLRTIVDVPEAVLRKILAEVNEYYSLTPEEFIRRRHSELRATGKYRNAEIYEILKREIVQRRFPRELSIRQIRRIIYG